MSEREISIECIAETKVNEEAVYRWLATMGVSKDFKLPDTRVDDESVVSDPALTVALAAKQCYMSFEPGLNPNVTKVRRDYTEYLDNILKSGHGSVLEHATWTFAIDGVTRVFTAEMNRHRAGWAISEKSLRFVRFDEDIPFWMPMSLRDEPDDEPTVKAAKKQSREIFRDAFSDCRMHYDRLKKIWDIEGRKQFAEKKKLTSMFRRIVPLGVCTGGVWTGNARALRHVMAMRASPAAEEEILHVFSQIAQVMSQQEPLLFGDFHQDDNGYWVPKYPKV